MVKRVDVSTIKSNIIASDLPEIQESMDASIQDESKGVIDNACKSVSQCNSKLKDSLKLLDKYMNSMADEFQKLDDKFAKVAEIQGPTISKGTSSYLNAI